MSSTYGRYQELMATIGSRPRSASEG